MSFLRSTTHIWDTQDLPGRFKEWKACLVEIGQTSYKLETNAHSICPIAENLAYQCMENGGRNMPTLIFLWLTVAIRYNIETNSSTLKVSRERAEICLSIVRRTNAEQRYQRWWQLTHFHCTIARRSPPHLSGSHVSFVSLADVKKTLECTTTPNPHVHKA